MKYDIIIEEINDWLITYLKKSKCDGFVVGVSGGIDSALTSTYVQEQGIQPFVSTCQYFKAKTK